MAAAAIRTASTGATGPQGPAGSVLQKRITFQFVPIPGQGVNGQLATLTFTSPVSGTAILRTVGFCNLQNNVQNEYNIASGTVLANVFNSPVPEWGVIRTIAGTPAATSAERYASDNAVAVTAGVPTTVFAAVRRIFPTAGGDCSGVFTVQVYGALP